MQQHVYELLQLLTRHHGRMQRREARGRLEIATESGADWRLHGCSRTAHLLRIFVEQYLRQQPQDA